MAQTFSITAETVIQIYDPLSRPVHHAIRIFQRDCAKVLGFMPTYGQLGGRNSIRLRYAGRGDRVAEQEETFSLFFPEAGVLEVVGSDDLGLVYGLLYLSERFLGVDPLWYWADREPVRKPGVAVPCEPYTMPTPRVRYRGWFINEEGCLLGWNGNFPPPNQMWFHVFEALLRLRGNMVIPGTGLPPAAGHWELAADMGLYQTHHHLEVLGAEYFRQRFPGLKPSYKENPQLFEALWREAVIRNRDKKVVWILGFRGQLDWPFWVDDPDVADDEARAAMIREIVEKQMAIVREHVAAPRFATYLYGEMAELYRSGALRFPAGVIKIWSDNGYGKMVSRRGHDLTDKRVPALPEPGDPGPHGLYYHLAFHDGRLHSNNLCPLTGPEMALHELTNGLRAEADRYWLINVGPLRPHLYMVDLVARLWEKGEMNLFSHRLRFCQRLLPSVATESADIIDRYYRTPVPVTEHDDQRMGELFYHAHMRYLIQDMLNQDLRRSKQVFVWATGEAPMPRQVKWFENKSFEALIRWTAMRYRAETLYERQPAAREHPFFFDQVMLPVLIHESSCRAFLNVIQAFWAVSSNPVNGTEVAWVYASDARDLIEECREAMNRAEHGKWEDFYAGDWTINVAASHRSVSALVEYLRVVGDNHHFVLWKNRYLGKKEGDTKINGKPAPDRQVLEAVRAHFKESGDWKPLDTMMAERG